MNKDQKTCLHTAFSLAMVEPVKSMAQFVHSKLLTNGGHKTVPKLKGAANGLSGVNSVLAIVG